MNVERVEIRDETLSASVLIGITKYSYAHESLLDQRQLSPGPDPDEDFDGWLASTQARMELSERWTSVSNRYFSGIRTTRAISVVEIKPLGEVVAGRRPAGYRERDGDLAVPPGPAEHAAPDRSTRFGESAE